jgi:dsRNA-specific ribonuclease
MFTFEVHAGSEVQAQGTGHSKRAAQQSAAHAALVRLDVTEGYEVPLDDHDPSNMDEDDED